MKKTLLLIFVALATTGAMAQPTITQIYGGVGDSIRYVEMDTMDLYGIISMGGANQNWDISTADTSGFRFTNYYVDPVNTPHAASYPTANHAMHSSQSPGHYVYHEATSTKLDMVGYESSSGGSLEYTDPHRMANLPLNYNDVVNDYFEGVVNNMGSVFYRSGTYTSTADAYGTLILPTGTYQNVLRTYTEQIYQDSFNIGGTPQYIYYRTIAYNWYVPNKNGPVLTFYNLKTESAGNTYYTRYAYMEASFNTGTGLTAVVDQDFMLYPNPSNGNVQVVLESENIREGHIRVFDVIGTVVYSQPIDTFISEIDLSALSAGTYMVEVQINGNRGVKKLMVQ